jgi:hypothetical protein
VLKSLEVFSEWSEKAPPVGTEHPSNSTGKTASAAEGAAESAAVSDPGLALIVANWGKLPVETRQAIIGMAQQASERPAR